jgi:hypothetical protein
MELVLSLKAQRAEDATGCNQRGTELLGEFAQRFATLNGSSLSHTVEISACPKIFLYPVAALQDVLCCGSITGNR